MRIIESYKPRKIEELVQGGENLPLISVILAAYNIEDYIEKGVCSVINQSYTNLEIIVVDDGSTDRTGKICDELAKKDKRVIVIHKQNGGPSEARNQGIAASKGRYIGFVDGDDFVDKKMYETLLCALLEEQADLAICRYRQVHKDHTEDASVDRAVVFEEQEALQAYVEERKEYAIQNAAWNKLYKREILENIRFPEGKWYEDIMFATYALGAAQRCVYLDTAYYNYIIDREGSIMNTQINPRTFTDQIPAYYEKTKYLVSIGRQDLADIHDYFFYKRLLQFYEQLSAKQDGSIAPGRDEAQSSDAAHNSETTQNHELHTYLCELEELLKKDRSRVEQVYTCSLATSKERKYLAAFYKSPALYCRKMQFEKQVIIPFKARVKAMLKR